ncbi:glycerol-3-phosphate dehydrogenase (NAD(P)+) [Muriicola jejuensis]|uniref:Glycerol-3-phosphate dehydrogenase n=1 Tax=Muriicola jejuensis TaxID=504488 RepID=A0A6P0UCD5_9FLAO|nr:NAD(P)H-dependent glycerol-3-phosphate dehydrogenase [Muriicola jejuensis]NER10150.1 glycerol-3-phosphate dehydrogenase [Muriicola jejuensis]SMP02649.1 glycerol-3-phosphate dehydrogenase (NAD(P)+) [Muriicola jejuensis]
MKKQVRFAVLGGGSWATALVKMLTKNLPKVTWYMRNSEAIEFIKTNKHNPNYLTSVEFRLSQLNLTDNIDVAVKAADVLIFAIPSAFLESELQKLSIPLKDKIIFSAIKGIVPESGKIVGEHFHDAYDIPLKNIGVITGPCHAEEVALDRLSYLTVASADKDKAKLVASKLGSESIKTKISDDIIGTEYAAMLKNIYALAAGIAHGLGYGDNFQSVLMSNAIREMKRYIKRVHKMKRNINNSAYLGDLLVTGYSTFSRNRMFGNMIGKGYTVKSAMMEMNMVAEGYYATKSAYEQKNSFKNKVRTPIIDTVYRILYQNESARKNFKALADRMD